MEPGIPKKAAPDTVGTIPTCCCSRHAHKSRRFRGDQGESSAWCRAARPARRGGTGRYSRAASPAGPQKLALAERNWAITFHA
jgi:hypothetical protein